MKTLIVSASKRAAKDLEKTQLVTSLNSFSGGDFELAITASNTDGLPVVYNRYITPEIASEFDCVLYVHDDVYIDDLKCFAKIEEQFNAGNSVVGLAGATGVSLTTPVLWHLMSKQNQWSGAVGHPAGTSSSGVDLTHVTSFGPTPKRCVILDGLFLATKPSNLVNVGVRFDEQFNFHHYDIDFCLQCNAAKLKLTTTNINVIHSSPGLTDPKSTTFTASEKSFINKHVKN